MNKPVPEWVRKQVFLKSKNLDVLKGVIDHPVLVGGRLQTGHVGFKDRFYISTPEFSVAKYDDPKAALEFLSKDWLGRFPFATPDDLYRSLLIPLTLLLRKTSITGGAPLALQLERDGEENPEMKEALAFTAANRGAILGALVAVASAPRLLDRSRAGFLYGNDWWQAR